MQIPLQNKKEYYEIRLESIGGLGANLCAKMLGELGIKYLGVNSSNFSSYGSEKTGTPVKGYVRFCKPQKEIRVHSPVIEPDLLVVFHQALLQDSSVWKGCNENTKVILALDSDKSEFMENEGKIIPSEIKEIFCLEAQSIAMETKSRINVVMLGAVLKIMGLESPEAGEQICRETLGKKYPASLENNLEGMRNGFAKVTKLKEKTASTRESNSIIGKTTGETESRKWEKTKAKSQQWGYLTAPEGGINPNIGSTVIADLSPSRQGYIPVFLKEKCINCGLCFSACPDMVFQFKKGEFKGKEMMINQGLDYYHCKGCLRCVDVCPVNALISKKEVRQERKEHFLPNQELLRKPEYYEKAGVDGYITSESFLTEKRMAGGEV